MKTSRKLIGTLGGKLKKTMKTLKNQFFRVFQSFPEFLKVFQKLLMKISNEFDDLMQILCSYRNILRLEPRKFS